MGFFPPFLKQFFSHDSSKAFLEFTLFSSPVFFKPYCYAALALEKLDQLLFEL